jgi:hypothetical protein
MKLFPCLSFLLVMVFPVWLLHGQANNARINLNKPLRIEIPVKSDNETYRIIPCGRSGLILFFKSIENAGEGKIKWIFSWYDNTLTRVWNKYVAIPENMDYISYSIENETVAFLFSLVGKDKESNYNFQVIRLNIITSKFTGNFGKIPDNFEISRFILRDQTAFLGLNSKNSFAAVHAMNLGTGHSNTISLNKEVNTTLLGLTIDTINSGIIAVIKKRLSKSHSECDLLTTDTTGKLIKEITISTISPERELNNIQLYHYSPSGFMVFGTYRNTRSKSSQKTMTGIESTGFFTTKIENGLQKDVNFYNFLDLKNSNSLLNTKESIALKKKAMKGNPGLTEYSLDLSLLMHVPVYRNGQFILLSESYSPQYHTENFTDFDFYGRPYTNSYTVFDGYRYTNGIITGFDGDGKLLWDNNMEIRNLISFELKPRVLDYLSGQDDILSYLSEGRIGSKVIHQNEIVEKLDFTALDLVSDDDKLLSETKGRMVFWYDTYFLCLGYQEIKNIAQEDKGKRLVFYFIKSRLNNPG